MYRTNTRIPSTTFLWDVVDMDKRARQTRADSSASIAYGLLQDAGVDTKGLSPHEAWELLGSMAKKDKKLSEKLSDATGKEMWSEVTSYRGNLHHMDIKGAKELYDRLSKGDYLSEKELRDHPVVRELERRAFEANDRYGRTSEINTPDREELRNGIKEDFLSRGSMVKHGDEWATVGAIKKGFSAEIVLGLPAAGKSSIITSDSKELGAFVFDADWIKEQLPEFQETDGLAASAVHDESTNIRDEAFDEFINGRMKGCNLILETIGRDPSWLDGKGGQLRMLEDAGYNVKIKLMNTDTKTCMNRSVKRAFETGRYVSVGNIYEASGLPEITYEYFARKGKNRRGVSYV